MSLLRAYSSASLRRPYLVGSLTAGTLFGLGDCIAQKAIEKNDGYDVARTARLVVWGSAIFAPLVTRELRLLSRIEFASKPATIAARVAADQLLFTPAVLAGFFTYSALAEGGSTTDVRKKLSDKYQPTLLKNWQLWMPTQIVNFSLVPIQLRTLVINAVALGWNTYLSLANAKK